MNPSPGDSITLAIDNRDEVMAFLADAAGDVREPDDLGSDVALVDLPDRRVVIVNGYTVTRVEREFIVTTRAGTERNRIPIRTSTTADSLAR